MKLGLVGPSYAENSLPFDAQRTINLIPYVNESQRGKEVAALYAAPGLEAIRNVPDGPVRGMFKAGNGRLFVVSNVNFYEFYTNTGVSTLHGVTNTPTENVSYADNGLQLAVCDGETLYIFTYATNAWAEVTHAEFPGASSVAYLDGYFIISKPDTGQFYISGLYDGHSWDALDFATAEASPGKIVRVYVANSELYLVGENDTENWVNVGGPNFPFVRRKGGEFKTGTGSPYTFRDLDNTYFFVGQDKDGRGIVYRANGNSPIRISTQAIEEKLRSCTDFASLRAWTYQVDGHAYYLITGSGLPDTTLVYDAFTRNWHERCYLNDDGVFERHLGVDCVFHEGIHYVGDRLDGTIYKMSDIYKDDNGQPMLAVRIFPHIVNEGKRQRFNELQVDFESDEPILGFDHTNTPVAMLQMSNDGGRSWGTEHQANIGRLGERKVRTRWSKLGITDTMTLKVSISDAVKRAICGAYMR